MSGNPLGIKGIHHIELWVGNAKQAAYYYRKAFGFSQLAYAGLETGNRVLASHALRQGKATLVLSTPLVPEHEAGEWLRLHGDGVRDIALEVEDAHAAFHEAVARGAEAAIEPRELRDERGCVRHAAVRTYGQTIHSFYSAAGYEGPFLPGFEAAEVAGEEVGLLLVDHIVGNVEDGKMEHWAEHYRKVFGFERYITFDDKDISTEFSALRSVVMANEKHTVKFPINEPASGRRKSQIQEYVEFNHGAGAQHLALLTGDIIETVTRLKANGVQFLEVPESYYETLEARVGKIDESIDDLKPLGILVDRDEEGYLLQLFTKPLEDRPTLFFEIIQRKGCRGFGKGNFKALFVSIEQEQARRGNL
jgi:4-hydroxyphenylpyruvate dioxygenase